MGQQPGNASGVLSAGPARALRSYVAPGACACSYCSRQRRPSGELLQNLVSTRIRSSGLHPASRKLHATCPNTATLLDSMHLKVKLCDARSGAFTHNLTGHREAVWAAAWSPSSQWHLASGSYDGQVPGTAVPATPASAVLQSLCLNTASASSPLCCGCFLCTTIRDNRHRCGCGTSGGQAVLRFSTSTPASAQRCCQPCQWRITGAQMLQCLVSGIWCWHANFVLVVYHVAF